MDIGFSKKIPLSIDQSCVGYWKLDEASGNIKDWSGNSNTGIAYNLSYSQTGKFGNSCSFNGTTSYVDCGTGLSLNMGTNDFTIHVWAKAISDITGRGIVDRGGWGNIGYFISQAYSPANSYYFGVRDSSGYKAVPIGLSSTFDWTHIVGLKTNNHIEVWTNCVKVATYDIAIGSLSNPTRSLLIGKSYDNYYFNGLIDEVRIYNRALSPQEIKRLYMAGR